MQNAISLSTLSVFLKALAGTASNGVQANGRQLPHHPTIRDAMTIMKMQMDIRANQKKAISESPVGRSGTRPEDRH